MGEMIARAAHAIAAAELDEGDGLFDVHALPEEVYDNYLRMASAAIAAIGCGWRDISTAPKDGAKLLGWEPPYTVPVGYAVFWWSGHGWVRDGDDFDLVFEPTHWMPLPDPPPLLQKGQLNERP